MNMGGKITKTEWILLVMAMIFLLLVGALYLRAAAVAEGADYTISTVRRTEDPVTPEPMASVDVNTADASLLQTLEGVGPALAQRIIDYREEHGAFQSVEELLKVKGIGEATLEGFRDRVTAGGQDGAGISSKETNG